MHLAKSSITFALIALILAAWALLLYFIEPQEIVDYFGIQNTYFIAFAVAVIGGVSIAGSAPVYAAIITFALGGANPLWLGVAAGLGVAVNDILFFYAATLGRHMLLAGRFSAAIERFSRWLAERPSWFLPFAVFFYCAFTPLPNDVLAVSLALAGVPLRRVIVPFALGSITLITIIATAATLGVSLTY